MEIVSIERKTFEAMVAKFDRFVSRMDAICHRHGEKKMSEWMDNQTTGFHETAALREIFGLTAIKPFHNWLMKMGYVDDRGHLTARAGDASTLF